jgi:hypothetical protein
MSDTTAHDNAVQAPAGSTWRALLPALLVAVMAFAGGAASEYAPPATGQMAVVFPPWIGEVEAFELVAEAGGQLVGPSRFGNIVIAFAPDVGFAARVGQHGALFTLKATGICGPASTQGSVT